MPRTRTLPSFSPVAAVTVMVSPPSTRVTVTGVDSGLISLVMDLTT